MHKQGRNLGFSSQVTVLSSNYRVVLQVPPAQPPCHLVSAATADSFEVKECISFSCWKHADLCIYLCERLWGWVLTRRQRYSILVEAQRGQGHRCALLTGLYCSLLVPLSVVNSVPGSSCLWAMPCEQQQGYAVTRTDGWSKPLGCSRKQTRRAAEAVLVCSLLSAAQGSRGWTLEKEFPPWKQT